MSGFKNLIGKFNKLPTAAKAGVSIGAGLLIYMVLGKKNSTAAMQSAAAEAVSTDQDGTVYYPYASANGSGFTESGSAYDWTQSNYELLTQQDLDGMIDEAVINWGAQYMESLGSKNNENATDTFAVGSVSLDQANQSLYEAQKAYGAAKTEAERSAAAAAGATARQNGATDAGADAIWKKNSAAASSASSSSTISGTGGSGKEFTKTADGAISVKYTNGTTKTIKPGEAGYAATNNAMKADLGIK